MRRGNQESLNSGFLFSSQPGDLVINWSIHLTSFFFLNHSLPYVEVAGLV